MAYILDSISIKTDSSPEAMAQVTALWQDIVSGRIPLMHDSEGTFQDGLSPITRFEDVSLASAEPYTMTILTVPAAFFAGLAADVEAGRYRLYEGSDPADIGKSADMAWEAAQKDIADGILDAARLSGYESTVPAQYTPDHQAHCYLYIAVPAAGTDG